MRSIAKGATDQSVIVRIVDAGDGTPETGVTSATAGLDLRYRREGGAEVALTETDLGAVNSAHSDGGIIHIRAGLYRVDLPDAAVATGADGVMVYGEVTGMVVIPCYVPLVAYNPQDATALGLSRLDAAITSRASQTSVDTIDDLLDTEIQSIMTDIATILAAVDTEVATIVSELGHGTYGLAALETLIDELESRLTAARAALLDNLDVAVSTRSTYAGADTAGTTTLLGRLSAARALLLDNMDAAVSTRASQASVDTIDNFLDTEIASIMTDVAAILAAVDTEITDLGSRLPAALVGGRMDSSVGAINNVVAAAQRLALSAGTIVAGAAIAGTLSTTEMTTDLTEATDDHYNGRVIIWTSGVLVNQATDITDYVGATKKLVYTATTEAPSAADTFIIV